MNRKDEIQVHFKQLTVRVRSDLGSGASGSIYDTKTDVNSRDEFRVLATYIHCFGDGSREPTFLIEGLRHKIRSIACCKCVVGLIS